jgi:putative FmdB family regulatory protein
MPTYDYRCSTCGVFELNRPMVDRAKGACPTCSSDCPKVILTAPTLDNTAMANQGYPGAIEKQGNDLERRHRAVPQAHTKRG